MQFTVLFIISLINFMPFNFIVKLIFQISVVSENWKVRLICIAVFGHLQPIILCLRLYSKWQHLNKLYRSQHVLAKNTLNKINKRLRDGSNEALLLTTTV